jgi:hypothetical protein
MRIARTAMAGAGLLMLAAGGTASAAEVSVTQGSFSSVQDCVDDEVCAPEGFAVQVHQVEDGHYTVRRDAEGNFVRALVHVTYDATISANGLTIEETDQWTEIYYPDGSHRQVGLTAHVKGPRGVVQLNAGEIIFNPDGTVASYSGPHSQLEGQFWCSALVPQ